MIDHRCGACGYGVAVPSLPAACPMCGAAAWRPVRTQADDPVRVGASREPIARPPALDIDHVAGARG